MSGERIRVTVAGRDAADLVPVEDEPAWTSGARAQALIESAQADPSLGEELKRAFPESTDDLNG